MITLTSDVKEKIVEETNKERYDHISNIKPYEKFLYMGKFNTLEPDKMFRNKTWWIWKDINNENKKI